MQLGLDERDDVIFNKKVETKELTPIESDLKELNEIIDKAIIEMEGNEQILLFLNSIDKKVDKLREKVTDIYEKVPHAATVDSINTVGNNNSKKLDSVNKKLSKSFILFLIIFTFIISFTMGIIAHKYETEITPYASTIFNFGGKVVEKTVTHGITGGN